MRFKNKEWNIETLLLKSSTFPFFLKPEHFSRDQWRSVFERNLRELVVKDAMTQKAYNRRLHHAPLVQQYRAMFKDAYLAELHREYLLSRIKKKAKQDYFNVITQFLNPYVEQLLKSDEKKIRLNDKAYKQVDLVNVDLNQFTGIQYLPPEVPGFPMITTYKWLDYIELYSNLVP
ncbi:MAG: hypothetical protein U5R06_06070 [candidate division KSB1 bacterium]|nr:hypothetical protein [candidate division KSB1 bacterium]